MLQVAGIECAQDVALPLVAERRLGQPIGVHTREAKRYDGLAHGRAESRPLGEFVDVPGIRGGLEHFIQQLVDQRLLGELVQQREPCAGQVGTHELQGERTHGGHLDPEPASAVPGERAQDLPPLAARGCHHQRARSGRRPFGFGGKRGKQCVAQRSRPLTPRSTTNGGVSTRSPSIATPDSSATSSCCLKSSIVI